MQSSSWSHLDAGVRFALHDDHSIVDALGGIIMFLVSLLQVILGRRNPVRPNIVKGWMGGIIHVPQREAGL
jgi:hypothetical protein